MSKIDVNRQVDLKIIGEKMVREEKVNTQLLHRIDCAQYDGTTRVYQCEKIHRGEKIHLLTARFSRVRVVIAFQQNKQYQERMAIKTSSDEGAVVSQVRTSLNYTVNRLFSPKFECETIMLVLFDLATLKANEADFAVSALNNRKQQMTTNGKFDMATNTYKIGGSSTTTNVSKATEKANAANDSSSESDDDDDDDNEEGAVIVIDARAHT